MSEAMDRANEIADRCIARDEAYRLGLTSKETDPDKVVEFRMLCDAMPEREWPGLRNWFAFGLVVSA